MSLFNLFVVLVFCSFIVCEAATISESNNKSNYEIIGRELVEEGRTLVHHAVKRFMIILPAIFFKLGIAFTLLVLVTLVAINNGFIGFLLLVVGLSSVLARLQESRRPAFTVQPYISPVSSYHHHHSAWDRNDVQTQNPEQTTDGNQLAYSGYVTQNQYSPVGYYGKYVSSKI